MTIPPSQTNPPQSGPSTAARQFAIEAARLAQSSHCRDISVLDVSGISPITDFLVLATGTSPRQMKTVCEEIEGLGEPLSFRPLTQSGLEGSTWVVQDFIDVVVHVFTHEARQFYDLDSLWGDAAKVDWQATK